MTRLQYIQTQIKQGEKKIELKEIPLGDTYCYGLDVYNPAWVWRYKMYYNIPGDIELKFPREIGVSDERDKSKCYHTNL